MCIIEYHFYIASWPLFIAKVIFHSIIIIILCILGHHQYVASLALCIVLHYYLYAEYIIITPVIIAKHYTIYYHDFYAFYIIIIKHFIIINPVHYRTSLLHSISSPVYFLSRLYNIILSMHCTLLITSVHYRQCITI